MKILLACLLILGSFSAFSKSDDGTGEQSSSTETNCTKISDATGDKGSQATVVNGDGNKSSESNED